jgi:exosortase family protein XrtF
VYLTLSDGVVYYPDYITHLVAVQTEALLNSLGYNTQVLPHPNEASIKVMVNGRYMARIIEGCNAVSISILFISFILAFTDQLKKTLLYGLAGVVIIYVFNLIRIVLLVIGLYHYPARQELLHNVVFPLVIYGTVFMLWIIWVKQFPKQNTYA